MKGTKHVTELRDLCSTLDFPNIRLLVECWAYLCCYLFIEFLTWVLADGLIFRLLLSGKNIKPQAGAWQMWGAGAGSSPGKYRLENSRYKLKGKYKKINRLRTLSSDLYPSQFHCGKAHLIPFGNRSKERRTLEKDRIGRIQTIPRRRIDENNHNVVRRRMWCREP